VSFTKNKLHEKNRKSVTEMFSSCNKIKLNC